MSSKSTTWIGGTVVLSVLILVAAWFVGISPTLASAATAEAAADLADTRNVQLQADLKRLEQQFAELETSKAALAELQLEIPTSGELSSYVRTVQSAAEAAGVTLISFSAGEPEDVVPAEIEAPAATQADADAESEGAGEDSTAADTSASPTGFAPIEGFVGIAYSMAVVGAPANVSAFLDDVQTGTERLYLVTAFSATGLNAGEPSNGRPATNDGDVEMSVSGYLYALAPTASATTPTEEPTLAPLPGGGQPRLGGS